MADGHGVPVGPDNIEFDIDTADAFLVDVDGFEGPLHLLLTLARRQKVDLKRVSVLDLAEQYLAFIADARDKRIDLAADYLLMAAWLAFLKSKLLLPKPEKTDKSEGVDPEDLAARLAFRLQRLDDGSVNEQDYALGWRWREWEIDGVGVARNANHGGVSRGSQCWLLLYPDYRMSMAFCTNTKTREFSTFGRFYEPLFRAFVTVAAAPNQGL